MDIVEGMSMDTWKIRMTFEGVVPAVSSSHAIAEFKAKLGLAPASMRSEVHMTECSSVRQAPDTDDPDDDSDGEPPVSNSAC